MIKSVSERDLDGKYMTTDFLFIFKLYAVTFPLLVYNFMSLDKGIESS